MLLQRPQTAGRQPPAPPRPKIELVIHSLRDACDKPESEGMLLIDGTNVLNNLNRKLALENIIVLCPPLAMAKYGIAFLPFVD